ncbi:MAG: (d)CMP kinase, partial [Lachnospiraceae bacterium]|nr:(d)CMP kinase [Lachnospiraceae bacterium]
MSFTIAIDGPAGAGKSTIAKLVAKELECIYVDTGAMYRALALYMVRKGVDIHDEKKVEAELAGADVSLMYDKGELKVMLNGENVAGIIRTPEVSEAASVVSAYRQVRKELVRRQQLMAEKTDLVMDGRDIGTCV